MSSTHAIHASPHAPRLRIAARVLTAILGGYAFSWGFIAAATALLCKAGMGFHDAEFLASALGLLVFLSVFLWAFAARRLARAAAVLLGGGALLAVTGSLVQASLV
jgi:hypothetical protein